MNMEIYRETVTEECSNEKSESESETNCVNVDVWNEVIKKLCGFYSASELYRLSNCRWSVNFNTYFCRLKGVVWSVRLFPTAVNLGFLDQSRFFFFQVSPHLSS
jgi:hypothetical protein